MLEHYFIYYGIALLAVIVSVVAQVKVQNAFSKNNKILSGRNITGVKFARDILSAAGLHDIDIVKIAGSMTDYYNHKKKIIALSNSHDSSSLAALGVAAHEVGHALQYKEGYVPIKVRNFLIPVINFSSKAMLPLVVIGIILSFFIQASIFSDVLIIGGVSVYTLALILNLVTLPVEYDASNRAKKLLLETGAVNSEEIKGVSEVLSAAALTYVAAALTSLLYLIRFLLIYGRRRD